MRDIGVDLAQLAGIQLCQYYLHYVQACTLKRVAQLIAACEFHAATLTTLPCIAM